MVDEHRDARRAIREQREQLVARLGSRSPLDLDEGTIIVLPSLTFPEDELRKIVGIEFYEDRLLFMLLALASPRLRLVFVSSLRVEEPIVDYYLSFLPSGADAGRRLYMVALWDPEPCALTAKVLANADAVQRLKAFAADSACLVPFNVTALEQSLADEITVPLYGPHPSLVHLGSKTGSRRVAREAGVPVLPGDEDLRSLAAVEEALRAVTATSAQPEAAVIKLNYGFSGQGNAIVELDELRSPLTETPTTFCAREESWPSFASKIEREGAIVEELVRHRGAVSPSVQMRIAADQTVEIVSSHDQILGGPDDQVYLGCRFPADEAYRAVIHDHADRIGKVLAAKGVIGSFGIDFVVVPDADPPSVYLSEINLRLGGTTHPFLMARLVTGGSYDTATGELIADGRAKCYIATDNLQSESYVGLEPQSLIDAVDRAGLGFDRRTKTGTTLHLLGALTKYGKVGVTCIADSRDDAQLLFEEVRALLRRLTVSP